MKPIMPHPDHHELHGITIAVDTHGPTVYVGRCHTMDGERIYLVDVDEHTVAADGTSKRAYLEQVAKFGHWKKHDRVTIERSDVAWFERLGKIAESGPPEACDG